MITPPLLNEATIDDIADELSRRGECCIVAYVRSPREGQEQLVERRRGGFCTVLGMMRWIEERLIGGGEHAEMAFDLLDGMKEDEADDDWKKGGGA